MKKRILLFMVLLMSVMRLSAHDFLRAVKDSIPDGYNFWVYTPIDYFYSQEQTPVIIFLHGASLCGRNLDRVRGYGTMDVCGTYPDRIAAGMALCGGTSLKDVSGLGKLPFWIIHGTADRAVSVNCSKTVVEKLKSEGNDQRLLYNWWQGAGHGAPARVFYLKKTYEWLFSHSLRDPDRHVRRDISIEMSDQRKAYSDITRGGGAPELIDGISVIKSEGFED